MRGMMRHLLLSLALFLASSEAFACDEGDPQVGPNCVHTEWLQYGRLKQEYTTLYRGGNRTKNIVWADFGTLKASHKTYIEVYDLWGGLDKFSWDPQKGRYVW